MSQYTADTIFLCIAIIDFGGIFICIGIGLYLAYAKMEMMLSHLKNCPAIMIRVFLIYTGPWGRLYVLGLIMGLMVIPGGFLRDGGASAEDLKNFPASLKYKLAFLLKTIWGLLVVMCGGAAYATFGRG
ncbi:hypothetical protein [Pseudomonas sp. NA-150]|uniref:hypothetical protein n=1 Tax=Pseudomonas sp. NA-150 TaxID=3367525 RepID=UPI0037C6AC29